MKIKWPFKKKKVKYIIEVDPSNVVIADVKAIPGVYVVMSSYKGKDNSNLKIHRL